MSGAVGGRLMGKRDERAVAAASGAEKGKNDVRNTDAGLQLYLHYIIVKRHFTRRLSRSCASGAICHVLTRKLGSQGKEEKKEEDEEEAYIHRLGRIKSYLIL